MPPVRPAQPDEVPRLLRWTLASRATPPPLPDTHVDLFRAYAEIMKLDLTRHWVIDDGDVRANACTVVPSPGRTAMVFLPPGFGRPERADATIALLAEVERYARDAGLRLLQCLIDPEEVSAAPLAAAGYRSLARLDYLERDVRDATRDFAPCDDASLAWRDYADDHRDEFARTIVATYEATRDCPALNGVRHIDDVMAGYRGATRFRPEHWQLLLASDEPAGCVLTGEIPLRNTLEIVYMGVVPRHRRRGRARHLVHRALQLARTAGLRTLSLAVDKNNEPAYRVYAAFGLRFSMSRDAWMRVLDGPTNG